MNSLECIMADMSLISFIEKIRLIRKPKIARNLPGEFNQTKMESDYLSLLNFILFQLEVSKKINEDCDDNPRPKKKRRL